MPYLSKRQIIVFLCNLPQEYKDFKKSLIMKSVGSTTWIYLFQRFRVPGLRPYVALNRPEQTMPPPPMEGGKGQAEVLAEVVDAPVFHVNNRFGSEWTNWSHDSSHEVANRPFL